MTGTFGERTRSFEPSSPDSVKKLNTPAGSLVALLTISASRAFTKAVCAGIFTTAVQPAARAGAEDRTDNTTGEFQGTLAPATPMGCLSNVENAPFLVCAP